MEFGLARRGGTRPVRAFIKGGGGLEPGPPARRRGLQGPAPPALADPRITLAGLSAHGDERDFVPGPVLAIMQEWNGGLTNIAGVHVHEADTQEESGDFLPVVHIAMAPRSHGKIEQLAAGAEDLAVFF